MPLEPAVLDAVSGEDGPSAADLHAAAVSAGVTVLNLFDNLPWFKTGADWTAWRAFLCAVYGLPMTDREYDVFVRCTGRKDAPTTKCEEFAAICGRRARKSAVAATIAVFEGGYRDYTPHLAPGERAMIPILSNDKDNAQAIRRFAEAILQEPGISHLLQGEPKGEEIPLTSRVDIKIRAAKITAGRSRAIPLALLDEVAFFPTKESATPDEDILRGIRPAMANIPGAMLGLLSSPYAQRGVLWEAYDKHFGVENDPVLVWTATTLTMHETPAIRVFVQKEWAKDPVAAAAEVGDENGRITFRADVKDFISPQVLKALVKEGRFELAPCSLEPVEPGQAEPDRFTYWAFTDPSGGSQDAFTLAIAHWEPAVKDEAGAVVTPGRAVLDLIRQEPAPFKPKAIVKKFAADIKRYHLGSVKGDAYAGEWPRDEFADNGIGYITSDRDKHDIYRDLLPNLNSGIVEFLDNEVLVDEFKSLQRRLTSTGREIIDHPQGQHDDVANSAAGALLDAITQGQFMTPPKIKPSYKTTEQIQAEISRQMEEEATGQKDNRRWWEERWNHE
jgi:hypothetical protein